MSKKQNLSPRKSKRIKLRVENEKNKIDQDHNYPHLTKVEWINSEVIIDDLKIEEPNVKLQLPSDYYNKENEIIAHISDHDYSSANLSAASNSAITLRQDLFPEKADQQNQNISILPDKNTSNTSPTKSVKTNSVKFILTKNLGRKSEAVTNCNRKLKPNILVVNKDTKLKNISDNSKDSIIDLTNDSKKSATSKFPVLLKKVDPKEVPLEIKEARSLLKSSINLTPCKLNQVVLKHAISSSKPDSPLLKIVEPEKVPNEIKEALSLTRKNQNLVVVNHELKEHSDPKKSTVRHEPNVPIKVNRKKIIKLKKNNVMYKKLTPNQVSQKKIVDNSDGKSDSEQLKSAAVKILETCVLTPTIESKPEKTPIFLRKVNPDQVPDQIKKSVPIVKTNTASNPQPSVSKANIATNLGDIQELEVSEVRLSSLANASQVSTVGSTMETSTVLGQDIMKPSTSNNRKVKNNDAVKVMNTHRFVDLTNESSDEDDYNGEELGLNSLQELKEFWELLVELHDYNKQVIRSQQNKKRRYLLRIKKLEEHLKIDLGLKFEDVEEKDYEIVELPQEIEPRTEEENVVVEKDNHPMEE